MAPARVVHEHVDAAQLGERLVDEVLALLDVPHIRGDDVGPPSRLGLHLGRDPFEVLGLAARQHDVGPVLGEEQCRRRADAGAAAGDHRDLAGVIEHLIHALTVRHGAASAPPVVRLVSPLMCGCIVALAAFISPRLGIFFIWLFTDRMSIAFDSFWWGFLGFLFLPWTTLAWAVAYAPRDGVTGFGWFIVILAFITDVMTHVGSAQARQQRKAQAA